MNAHPNRILGDFLRDRRQRLDPAALDLPTIRRRRTSGLRREEVAERAGIGVDWYIRLEQGRFAALPSATVDALAGALCLDETEHDHLRALAGIRAVESFRQESVPDSIKMLVSGLKEPAYITGQRWDIVFWNEAASRLLVDFDTIPESERNILLFTFLDPSAKRLFGDGWETMAQKMVGLFRKTYDLRASDEAFRSLVATLLDGNPQFADWWRAHDIERSDAKTKTIYHEGTARSYVYGVFQIADAPSLQLAIYSPV